MSAIKESAVVRELFEFLRFPSVSAQPSHRGDVAACARWLAAYLRGSGLSTRLYPTRGHPILVARSRPSAARSSSWPTVLIYGHYDVQPPEPLALWKSPPFRPVIRNGQIYARGAMDNKGQIFCHIQAVRSMLRNGGELPVDVIFLIEGEEEVGSRNLTPFVQQHRRELRADVCVVSDSSMYGPKEPAITYSLRGVVCLEVRVTGPSHDLHSGFYGGTLDNPAMALARMLAGLIDREGRITIPGFYRDVLPLTRAERQRLARLRFSAAEFQGSIGVPSLCGERGCTVNERRWARPSCDINGIFGGYQGDGSKTVIPSWAGVKLSFRLVPEQRPGRIVSLFRAHLAGTMPRTVRWKLLTHELGAEPYFVAPGGPYTRAAERAIEAGFGRKPCWIRQGGSIPIVPMFKKILGIDTLLIGFGLGEDGAHSPNEHFGLDRLRNGIRTSQALLRELGAARGKA